MTGLMRADHHVRSTALPGLRLRLRERCPQAGAGGAATPLLLVHGATVPSALWDNAAPGWSWMDMLARDGLHVFAVDLRGYGRSGRGAVAGQATDGGPYARAREVQQDVADALAFIRERTGAGQVDLLGGSWGSLICGMFAAGAMADQVRRLVLYAPLYCAPGEGEGWRRAAADPADPARIDPALAAHRQVSEAAFRARWDEELPAGNAQAWRPEAVFRALFDECLAEDPDCVGVGAPAFRAPNGTLADLFEVYSGRPLYDAGAIRAPTLLIRADHDRTSTRGDVLGLFDRIAAPVKQYVEIGDGGHFVIAERRMTGVHAAVTAFLQR